MEKNEKSAVTITDIQKAIKAPKVQKNAFGGYSYRTVEEIYTSAKAACEQFGAVLTVSDEIQQVGERYYVKATARLMVDGKTYEASAFAREDDTKRGMDVAQITGACSSYARKYALCGLFLIDGAADFDAMNNTIAPTPKETQKVPMVRNAKEAIATIQTAPDMESLKSFWESLPIGVKCLDAVLEAKEIKKKSLIQ